MARNEMTKELMARCESIVDGFDELLSGRPNSDALTKQVILRNWFDAQRILSELARATGIPFNQMFVDLPELDEVPTLKGFSQN